MSRFSIWSIAYVIGVAVLAVPSTVHAALYDVQIQRSDVTFVPTAFVVGDHVRVYATVKNVGERDVQGNVFFSENGAAIGTPPPFSVRARGAEEEVWVDWQPAMVGERQIFIRIVTAPETRDEKQTNNEMIVPVTIRDRAPPPQSPSTVSGGSGSGASVFGAPAGVTPSGTSTSPSSPPAPSAPAPAPKKASTTSGAAGARTGVNPPAAAIRPAVPTAVLAPATSVPAAAPLPETSTPPPASPYDEQLRQLLGRPASPWRSALPLAAAGVAVAAVATIVILRFRHRAHGETQRGTSETMDRRPPRTS